MKIITTDIHRVHIKRQSANCKSILHLSLSLNTLEHYYISYICVKKPACSSLEPAHIEQKFVKNTFSDGTRPTAALQLSSLPCIFTTSRPIQIQEGKILQPERLMYKAVHMCYIKKTLGPRPLMKPQLMCLN